MIGLSRAEWRKSTFSTSGGNCVEVAYLRDGRVGVRDSKCHEAGAVLFAQGAIVALLMGIKAGEFDWSA